MSFPVPLSPDTTIGALADANRWIRSRIACMAFERPKITSGGGMASALVAALAEPRNEC